MDEFTVDLIAQDPQQRPEAVTLYRVIALSKTEAGLLARSLMAAPEYWKVLDVKPRA